MGILDIIAAVALVGMGAMVWATELGAKYGPSESIIQLAQALVATGALLVPLGALSIADASRHTGLTARAAGACACVVALGSAAWALLAWASRGAFMVWGLIGVVLGLVTLALVRSGH
jgi:hypothetical protein